MNKELLRRLIKEADSKEDSKKDTTKGVAAAGAGAGALYKSAPHITGRDRLYHGTHSKNMDSILKDGIKAKFTGQAGSNTEAMKGARPEAFKRSLDKTFAAKNYRSAKGFAAQTEAGGVQQAAQDPIKMLKGLNPFKKNVAKLRTPTWKMDTTVNPEVGNASFKEWRKEVDPMGMKSDSNLKSAYKRLKDGTETFVGDIDSKYIKGSDKYQGAGLKEIKEFAKANPKRFAGGLALGGAGLAGLGYAGKKLYDRKKKDKEKNAFVQLGMNKIAAIDLEQNNAGEYGLGRFYKPKQTAKKSLPGLAGAGIGGFTANRFTKDEKNKKRNTMLGAIGGGTVGELARRIKTSSNLAELNQRNETVATSFSPRRDDEMTEKMKRLIREYENDRG